MFFSPFFCQIHQRSRTIYLLQWRGDFVENMGKFIKWGFSILKWRVLNILYIFQMKNNYKPAWNLQQEYQVIQRHRNREKPAFPFQVVDKMNLIGLMVWLYVKLMRARRAWDVSVPPIGHKANQVTEKMTSALDRPDELHVSWHLTM